MTDYNQFHDSLADVPLQPKKLPEMINVLTILTFIWCGISFLHAIYSYFNVCKSVNVMEESASKIADSPMARFMDVNALTESVIRQCESRFPIMIITIVCSLLCLVGAIQMRKQKRAGFFIYFLGEIALPVTTIVLVGTGTGFWLLLGFLFPVLFIILYATQLKHMK